MEADEDSVIKVQPQKTIVLNNNNIFKIVIPIFICFVWFYGSGMLIFGVPYLEVKILGFIMFLVAFGISFLFYRGFLKWKKFIIEVSYFIYQDRVEIIDGYNGKSHIVLFDKINDVDIVKETSELRTLIIYDKSSFRNTNTFLERMSDLTYFKSKIGDNATTLFYIDKIQAIKIYKKIKA